MGNVRYSALEADKGFSTEAFTADDVGKLVVTSIDAEEIKLGGLVIFSTAEGGNDTLVSSIVKSSLEELGTLNFLTVSGNVSLTGGLVTITSSTAGSINNVNIGNVTKGSGAFTTLTATGNISFTSPGQAVAISPTGPVAISPTGTVAISPTGTVTVSPTSDLIISPQGTISITPTTVGSINNIAIGATTARSGRFTNVTLTEEATENNQAPTKKYVDVRTTALSIALGT